jgi:hypothetical protein
MATKPSVSIKFDLSNLINRLDRSTDNYKAIKQLALKQLGWSLLEFIKSVTPVRSIAGVLSLPPGSTRESWRVRIDSHGNGVIVYSPLETAAFLVQGVRPHIILPQPPYKVLKFEIGGQIIFTPMVNHPGYESRHIREQAEEYIAEEGHRIIATYYKGVLIR